jgi:hypothetical protein
MGRRRVGAVLALLASVTIGTSGCVAPARSYDAYEGKAADTADSVLSAVETARLAATAGGEDDAFAQYLSVVLGEAEGDASGARGLFESIQPPDPRSDRLRAELVRLLDRAVDDLARLRIWVRRGDVAGLPRLDRPLQSVSQELDAFSKAHS